MTPFSFDELQQFNLWIIKYVKFVTYDSGIHRPSRSTIYINITSLYIRLYWTQNNILCASIASRLTQTHIIDLVVAKDNHTNKWLCLGGEGSAIQCMHSYSNAIDVGLPYQHWKSGRDSEFLASVEEISMPELKLIVLEMKFENNEKWSRSLDQHAANTNSCPF